MTDAMYVEKGATGWIVCEDDGAILHTFRSKSAATQWMREMNRAIRYDQQADVDEQFLSIYGPFLK